MCQGQIHTDPEHKCFKVISKTQQTIFSAHWGNSSRKIGLLPKRNNFFTNIEKLTWGNKVELVGQMIATFYDICIKTWRKSRATESLKLGFHSELTRVKQVD